MCIYVCMYIYIYIYIHRDIYASWSISTFDIECIRIAIVIAISFLHRRSWRRRGRGTPWWRTSCSWTDDDGGFQWLDLRENLGNHRFSHEIWDFPVIFPQTVPLRIILPDLSNAAQMKSFLHRFEQRNPFSIPIYLVPSRCCMIFSDLLAWNPRQNTLVETLPGLGWNQPRSYFSALPPFMIAVVLSVYVAGSPESFSAAMIFTALSLLNQIRFPVLFYPNALGRWHHQWDSHGILW